MRVLANQAREGPRPFAILVCVSCAESRSLGRLGEGSDRQGKQRGLEAFRRSVWAPLRSREHRGELCVSVQRNLFAR